MLRRGKKCEISNSRDDSCRHGFLFGSGSAPVRVVFGGRFRSDRRPWRSVLGAGDSPAREGHVVSWSQPRGIPEPPPRRKAACSSTHGCELHAAFRSGPPLPGVGSVAPTRPRVSCVTEPGVIRSVRHGLRRGVGGPPPRLSARGHSGVGVASGGTPPRSSPDSQHRATRALEEPAGTHPRRRRTGTPAASRTRWTHKTPHSPPRGAHRTRQPKKHSCAILAAALCRGTWTRSGHVAATKP